MATGFEDEDDDDDDIELGFPEKNNVEITSSPI
jgi:hypothetical protein